MNNSTLSAYLRGARKPAAEFVLLLAIILELNRGQKTALIDALIGDIQFDLFQEFALTSKRFYRMLEALTKKSENVP